MAGTEFAFEQVLDLGRIDLVLLRLGVEVGFGWREEHGNAGFAQLRAVGLEGAGVLVEVLVRPELQTVDEDAGDDRVAMGLRLPHQGNVPLVQVAHGRDEDDAAAVLQRGACF